VSSNVQYVCERSSDLRKMPRKIRMKLRRSAWANNPPKLAPRAWRLAIENGSAAPTRNENAG
jgi:hypothetical protein